MAEAVRCAAAVYPPPHPNPRVGCVLVAPDGREVARAAHLRTGEAHAEGRALEIAGDAARGGTAYVTLEPCSHQGRTPPCADGLIEAGVVCVVVGHEDPDPRVGGRGLQRLRDAGITVITGVLRDAAEALNRGFLKRQRTQRPWVTLKLAGSIDGRTAMASGESRWITGAAARRDVHRLRGEAAAVLTGYGTVQADDPALTVRDLDPARSGRDAALDPARQPLRVVLDPHLETPADARVLHSPGRVLILHVDDPHGRAPKLADAGAEVQALPADPRGWLDLDAVLAEMGTRSINHVLAECGSTLAGALIAGAHVDEVVLYQAPHWMGDAARPLAHLPGIDAMAQRRPYRFTDVRQVGDDLRVTLQPRTDPPGH